MKVRTVWFVDSKVSIWNFVYWSYNIPFSLCSCVTICVIFFFFKLNFWIIGTVFDSLLEKSFFLFSSFENNSYIGKYCFNDFQ